MTTISKTMDWFIVDSMRNLSKNGYDVTLISNMEEGFIDRNSDYATCINLPMSRGVSIKDVLKCTNFLRKYFKKEKFDVIYYTSPNVSLYASIAGVLAGVQIRFYSQCGLRYVSFSGIKKKIFWLVEKITCMLSTTIRSQSPLNMQFAIDEKLCSKEKISVVGIGGTTGVDLAKCDSFDHEKMKWILRNKYNIPHQVVEVICNHPFKFANRVISNDEDTKTIMFGYLFKIKPKRKYEKTRENEKQNN